MLKVKFKGRGNIFPHCSGPTCGSGGRRHSILLDSPRLSGYFFVTVRSGISVHFGSMRFTVVTSTSSSMRPAPGVPSRMGGNRVSCMIGKSLTCRSG